MLVPKPQCLEIGPPGLRFLHELNLCAPGGLVNGEGRT